MRLKIKSKKHWHELRRTHIGASEVASLFDCGYLSHFDLWHQKKGLLPVEDLSDNERVVIGRNVENGIAAASGELFGYELVKAKCYLIDEIEPGLGSTPDFFLVKNGSEFPAEIKNASWGQWRDNWITNEDGSVEPPLRYQLQVQTQLACDNAHEGVLIALISGDRIVRCEIARHEEAIIEIRKRVHAFWKSITANEPPPAQMPQDYASATKLWPGGKGAADLSGDTLIETWLASYSELATHQHRVEDEMQSIKGEILQYCTSRDLASIKAHTGRISCTWRNTKPAHTRQFKEQPGHNEVRITVAR